jgi:hypothetical protein
LLPGGEAEPEERGLRVREHGEQRQQTSELLEMVGADEVKRIVIGSD